MSEPIFNSFSISRAKWRLSACLTKLKPRFITRIFTISPTTRTKYSTICQNSVEKRWKTAFDVSLRQCRNTCFCFPATYRFELKGKVHSISFLPRYAIELLEFGVATANVVSGGSKASGCDWLRRCFSHRLLVAKCVAEPARRSLRNLSAQRQSLRGAAVPNSGEDRRRGFAARKTLHSKRFAINFAGYCVRVARR